MPLDGDKAAQRKPARAAKRNRLYRPGLVAAAIVMLWAADNEPAAFGPASVAIWLLGAVTAGLLARAAFAVGEPLIRMIAALLVQATQPRNGVEEP